MRFLRPLAGFCACVALLAACTSGTHSPPPASPGRSSAGSSVATSAAPATGANSPTVAPVSQGRVRAKAASSCPLLTKSFVQNTVGMRLARITVLRNDVRLVGCRFYALQNSPLARTEHLPGPNQPAVEIVTTRYRTAVDAHNAFVQAADRGTNPQQHTLTGSVATVCYQTAFDPADHDQDWACGFSKATTAVLVRVAQTTPALNTLLVTQKAVSAL